MCGFSQCCAGGLPLAEGCSMLQSWQAGGVTNVNESRKTCRYMASAEVNV